MADISAANMSAANMSAANISVADVKKLRDLTGAGFMECKKALQEADGDLDKAVEVLRISGAAKAAKRGAEREASNGMVAAGAGVLVELNCETDFVAKNEDFLALAEQVAGVASQLRPADAEALAASPMPSGRTVAEEVAALSAVIGEKLALGRVAVFEGRTTVYLHRRSKDLPPQVGVLVAYEGDEEAARGAAMQVAALRPQYLSRGDVPAEVLENERRIAEATAREEGKPEAALSRIVDGRVNGFYKDAVLLDQPSVHDAKKTVRMLLEAAGTTVTRFARFEVGA